MSTLKIISIGMSEDTRSKIASISKHTGISQQKLYRTALDSYANDPHVPPVDLTPFVNNKPPEPPEGEYDKHEGWD